MKKVAAYIRVSTDGQCGDDKFGLDVQREQISAYCGRHDMEITQWFMDEGESGAKERPGFDNIVYNPDFANPPFEAVVVAKTDRVARDINVYYYYKMMLRKKNVELVSVAEDFGQFGVFSSMLEAFTLCVAEMERDNITKRTSGGRTVKAAQGGYAGGRPPYGYATDAKHNLVVVEEEAALVRRVFELRGEGKTFRGVVEIINSEGFTTRKGGKFVVSGIQRILDNEKLYRGFYKYGDSEEYVVGQHEAIL